MKEKSRKFMRKSLSMMMAVILVFGLLPVGVFGDSFPLETTYSGTITGEVKPAIHYYENYNSKDLSMDSTFGGQIFENEIEFYADYNFTVNQTGFYKMELSDNANKDVSESTYPFIIDSQSVRVPYYADWDGDYLNNKTINNGIYYYLTTGETYRLFIRSYYTCEFSASLKYYGIEISDTIPVYNLNENGEIIGIDNSRNLSWKLTQDGKLTISGNGNLVINGKHSEWFTLCDRVFEINIEDGITSIEEGQFDELSCIKSVSIPATVNKIGTTFWGCNKLENIKFYGNAPTFSKLEYSGEESSAFSDVTATAYYPAGNSTWTPAVMQNYGGNITWVPYDDEQGTKLTDAVKFVPYYAEIPNAESNAKYSLESGSLPQGISLLEDGTLEGVPKESGTFKFKVKSNSGTVSDTLILTAKDNTDGNVGGETDDGYEITQKVEDMEPDEYRDQVFEISGDGEEDLTYDEFRDLWLDGEKLVRGESLDDENIDYIAEEGSTKITIRAQTFKKAGNGRHTIAASFRNSRGQLKVATQNYTVGRKNANSGNTVTKPQPKPVDPGDDGFIDVEPTDWFYEDVKWVHDNDLMVGVGGQRFAPQGSITNGMVVTVLARIAGVDLTQFANNSYPGIEIGKWYTEPAYWARENGIIINNTFAGKGACLRGHMALMIMRYLDNIGVSYTVPDMEITIADADQMTSEELRAFEVLGKLGIFKGKKNNMMDPNGMTTRAELAALVHRLSDEINKQR